MKKTARQEIISVCEDVARRNPRISLAVFRCRCWRKFPEWAHEQIKNTTKIWGPVLILVDDFYCELQRKKAWDEVFLKKD